MFALRLLSEGGEAPNTELLWVLWILLGFLALAVIIGWWAGSRKPKQIEAESEATLSPSPVKTKSADDLARIEGIGLKVVKILAHAGIMTFEDLAHSKSADLQKVLNKAGMQMMNPEGWIDQAKLAAKGDWDGLARLQGQMEGGRKKK